MNGNRRKEEAVFKAAIEIDSPQERATYVKSACGQDARLLRRVEALLKSHYDHDSFLTSPPACADITLDKSPLTEGPGTQIGRYKLLQLIGEGGFGAVYMAEQERPVRRRVALKIIKLGMDTKQVIARFEAERQALAMMDHPNIAKVFDGGATDTGRPYFVMELVKGVPITEYCDQNNLDTQQRLELFVDVCKAVQHAHQKGIIHRDIKPSNVMITLHDGEPVPKVIDFGIAKATEHRLTEKTLFTEYQQFIGTPEYMSPEQAEMSGLDVDTRSDIYSLGVLLYELLTGTTPFEAKNLRCAAYDEIRRIIREEEPPKPSTRLSTLGETLPEIARHRHVQAGELRRIISGDLDWIAMKSLEKDRTRRYETASDLAQDINRHLRHEPVAAGPPSTVYRVKKFVRRNRTPVTAVAIVLAVLSAGIVVSTVFAIGQSRARKQADDARGIAEAAGKRETEARIEAETARDKAQSAEKVAEGHRLQAQRLLAKSQIDRGVRLLNEGNCLGLLDLLEARKTADEIPDLLDQSGRLWAIAYDVCAGRLLQLLSGGGDQGMAFSPDGRLLAVAHGQTAQLWDTKTWRPHGPSLQLGKHIGAVLFSPDGRLIAAHSIEGESRLWEAATGQPVGLILRSDDRRGRSFRKENDLSNARRSAAFSPDGSLLATASLCGAACLWDTNTGRPYGKPLQHEDEVWTVAFSPDGTLLASGSGDGSVRLWEVASGEPYCPAAQHGGVVAGVIFSPDGRLLVSMSCDDGWQLWSVEEKRILKRLSVEARVQDLALSPDGRLVAAALANWRAQLWDTATGEAHSHKLHHDASARLVEFSPSGTLLATTSNDKSVRLWEVPTGRPCGNPLWHQDSTYAVKFSPDDRLVASSSRDGTIRIWSPYQPLPTDSVRRRIADDLGAVSPDGRVGAIILHDTVQLWDTVTLEPLCEPLQNGDSVTAVDFSPDGRLVAIGSKGTVRLWDIGQSETFGSPLKTEEEAIINMLTFSPDGQQLAVAANNWLAEIFEVRAGQRSFSLSCSGNVLGVAFSPDARVLASGSHNGLVEQWDLTTGLRLDSPLHSRGEVLDLAYSPDGNVLATVSRNDQSSCVQLWDVSVGPPYYSLTLSSVIVADGLALRSFSRDGTLLVKTLREARARVWRLPKAPSDLREMQLLTWIALGAQRNDQSEVIPTMSKKWHTLVQELGGRMKASKPRIIAAQRSGGSSEVELVWTPPPDAVTQYVYFGTDPNNLGLLAKVEDPCCANLPPLDRGSTYWWRVDTVRADGSEAKGDLWTSRAGRLVARWKFDEPEGPTVVDSSGNGLNGELMEDARIVEDAERGKVLGLDGGYLDCGNTPEYDITSEITVAAWIRPDDCGNGKSNPYVGRGDHAYQLRHSDANAVEFFIHDETPRAVQYAVDSSFNGAWHHLAGTYDGNCLNLYVDGVLQASAEHKGSIDSETSAVNLGRSCDYSESFYNGALDDVRIYSYALTPADISAIYAGREPEAENEPKWSVSDARGHSFSLAESGLNRGRDYYVPSDSGKDEREERVLRLDALNMACSALRNSEEPGASPFWRERGSIHMSLRHWDKAIADYTRAIELEPANSGYWCERGESYLGLGKPERAVADCTRAIELEPDRLRYRFIRAQAYTRLGDLKAAISDCRKAIEMSPATSECWGKLGECLMKLGNHEEAVANFTKAIELDPASSSYLARRAECHLIIGDPEKAVTDYDRAIELDPGNCRQLLLRGQGHMRLGNLEEAVLDFTKATELEPSKLDGWIKRSECRLRLGKFEEALSDCTRAIELDPNNARCWEMRGQCCWELGDPEKALRYYTEAIELAPDNPRFRELRGICHRDLEKPEKALADFSKAIELAPDNPRFRDLRGQCYLSLENPEKAVDDYTRAIELDPNDARFWHMRGECYLRLDEAEKSIADYAKAIELEPGDLHFRQQQAKGYIQLGRLDELLTIRSAEVEDDPNNPDRWHARADVYFEQQQWDKALTDYSQAILLDPNGSRCWHLRGKTYGELEQWDNAVADYSQAIKLDPNWSGNWHWRAYTYKELEQWDNAVADYSKAIELEPDNLYHWYWRGVTYNNMKQWDRALSDFSKTIELDPDNPYLVQARGYTYDSAGQFERAISDLSTAIEMDPNVVNSWVARANVYANMKQWDKVAADYSSAIELDPNNPLWPYRCALAHLGTGDTEGYRKTCDEFLERFEDTNDSGVCHWLAWTCALGPDAVEDFNNVVELAEVLVEGGGASDQGRGALGAILYRAGSFDEAVQILGESTAVWEQSEELRTNTSPAYTWFFLAMAHYKLGNTDQSQKYFDMAVKRTEEEMAGDVAWNRRLTLRLWRDETAQLSGIQQQALPKTGNTE